MYRKIRKFYDMSISVTDFVMMTNYIILKKLQKIGNNCFVKLTNTLRPCEYVNEDKMRRGRGRGKREIMVRG